MLIICVLILYSFIFRRLDRKEKEVVDIADESGVVTYDNKPLNVLAFKKKTTDLQFNCRSTIIECDDHSTCQNSCSGGKSECINGFCSYVYDSNSSLCQNGGIPISIFYRGRFDYINCICPPTHIGRFCDVQNKMLILNPEDSNKYLTNIKKRPNNATVLSSG